MLAAWFRRMDWKTRHGHYRQLKAQPRWAHVIDELEARMSSDELIAGRAGPLMIEDGVVLPLPFVRRGPRQHKLTDFWKLIPRPKTKSHMKQRLITCYFKKLQR